MYFECNLPTVAPTTVDVKKRKELTILLLAIHERTKKLEKAFRIAEEAVGCSGEQFSMAAKDIFEKKTDTGLRMIDVLSAEKIAEYCINMGCDVFDYEPRLEWPNAIVLVDTTFVTTKEWEAIRVLGLGGSDAAVTLGLSPYRTAIELFYDKTGQGEKLEDKTDTGKEFIFAYGHKLEDLVIDEFCRRTGAVRVPETRMFQKKGFDYINANIDAIVRMNGEYYIFEAKTTTFFNKEAWKDGAVPVQYESQCRQYMAVLNDPRIKGTYIGCIYGNTPSDWACSFIKRDLDEENEQLEAETEFWENYVLSGERPPLSGKADKDKEVLSKIHTEKKATVVLDGEENLKEKLDRLNALTEERLDYTHKVKNLEKLENQIKNEIADIMGTASKGTYTIDDVSYYELSYSSRTRTVVNQSALDLFLAPLSDEEKEKIKTKVVGARSLSLKIKSK